MAAGLFAASAGNKVCCLFVAGTLSPCCPAVQLMDQVYNLDSGAVWARRGVEVAFADTV